LADLGVGLGVVHPLVDNEQAEERRDAVLLFELEQVLVGRVLAEETFEEVGGQVELADRDLVLQGPVELRDRLGFLEEQPVVLPPCGGEQRYQKGYGDAEAADARDQVRGLLVRRCGEKSEKRNPKQIRNPKSQIQTVRATLAAF